MMFVTLRIYFLFSLLINKLYILRCLTVKHIKPEKKNNDDNKLNLTHYNIE